MRQLAQAREPIAAIFLKQAGDIVARVGDERPMRDDRIALRLAIEDLTFDQQRDRLEPGVRVGPSQRTLAQIEMIVGKHDEWTFSA